jgi:DUF1009 family protein
MSGSTLGIIAGGGDLPRAIAEAASSAGRKVFVVGLQGMAEPWVERFPHAWVSLGETGKAFSSLRGAECGDVILIGKVARPKFAEIKLDAKSVLLAPRIVAAALKGDDVLLRAVVDLFEREGFRAVSAVEAAPGLVAQAGPLGRYKPNGENSNDIALGLKVVRALGDLDIAQATVVCNGLVLSVEAAEGTDAMLARVTDLPEHLRGTTAKRRGVLVKAPKPIQDGKTDLPVIGVKTVANAAKVGLAGIAVEAGGALIVDRAAVAAAADAAGLFVTGIAP